MLRYRKIGRKGLCAFDGRKKSILPPSLLCLKTHCLPQTPANASVFSLGFFLHTGETEGRRRANSKVGEKKRGGKKWRPNFPHKKRKEKSQNETHPYSPSSICNSPLDHKKRERKRGPIRVKEEAWGLSFFCLKTCGNLNEFPFFSPLPATTATRETSLGRQWCRRRIVRTWLWTRRWRRATGRCWRGRQRQVRRRHQGSSSRWVFKKTISIRYFIFLHL